MRIVTIRDMPKSISLPDELQVSEQALISVLLSQSREGLCLFDAEGQVSLLNQRMQDWLGLSPKYPLDLNDLLAANEEKSRLLRAINQKKPARTYFELLLQTESSETVPVQAHLHRVPGDALKWILLCNDVQREKQLESTLSDSQEQHIRLLQILPVPVAIVRCSDGAILQGNEEFGHWYGLPVNSLTAVNIMSFFVRASDWLFLSSETRRQQGTLIREVQVRNPDKSVAWSRVFVQEIDFEGSAALLLAFSDITQIKQVEQSLEWSYRLQRAIMTAQSQFVSSIDPDTLFLHILEHLMGITYAEFGCLIAFDLDAPEQLDVLALNHTRWNLDMVESFVHSAPNEFNELHQNASPLFSALDSDSNQFIWLDQDLPFPWLKNFVGVPLYSSGDRVGMLGLGNVPREFSDILHMELNPLLITAGNIIAAWRNDNLRCEAEAEQQRSHQELLHLHQDLRQLIDNASTPIIALTHQGVISEWNAAAEQLTGLAARSTTQRQLIYQVLERNSHRTFEASFNSVLAGETVAGLELDLRTTEAHHSRRILCSLTPRRLSEQEPAGVWLLAQDITVLAHYQESLKRDVQLKTRELEAALFDRHQLTQRLRQSMEKQEEVSALNQRFAGLASHEFRGPLAYIQMATDMLYNHGDEMEPAQIRKRIVRIKARAEQLHFIVHDILLLIQLDAGHLSFHPQPCDLQQLCFQITEEVHLATYRSHQIQLDVPELEARLDCNLVHLLLYNLLQNAVKYSFEHDQVCLRLRLQGEMLCFEIEDWGIGITVEERPHIFEPFYRSKRVSELTSGSGLGLELVRRAVDLHQGSIDVIQKDLGVRFEVRLPYREAR